MSNGVGGWVGEYMSRMQSFSQCEKMHNFEKLRTQTYNTKNADNLLPSALARGY